MVAKILGVLVLALAVSSCGKFTLGESNDEISIDKNLGGCKLDSPIALDNEDIKIGLTLRGARLDPHAATFDKTELTVLFFEIRVNDRPNGMLGARLENRAGATRGFYNDYLGNYKFTSNNHKVNNTMLYETRLLDGERTVNQVKVLVKDKAIQGIQLEFEQPGAFLSEELKKKNDVVCVKSATR